MPTYANRGGDSNVVSYEHGAGWIEVTFGDRKTYRYEDHSAGAAAIVKMQQLAAAGRGLQGYINEHRPLYVSKSA